MSESKIGPLFAQSLDAAETLVSALASLAPGELSIDVPEHQQEFSNILAQAGMLPGFTTARMYRGDPPKLRNGWIFSITTLELG